MSEVIKKSHPESFMIAVDYDSDVGRELMHHKPEIDFSMYWQDHDDEVEEGDEYSSDIREVVVLQATISNRIILAEVVEKTLYK